MKTITILATVSLLATGCASTVVPYLKGQNAPADSGVVVDSNGNETGRSFCSRVSTTADDRSQRYLVPGILLSVVASAALVAGAAMGPDTSPEANWAARNRNTLVLGAGGILAVPSTLLLMRSRDTSTASATAGQAMGLEDDKAMSQCLQARADLVNARGALATFAQKDLADRLKVLQEVKEKADQAVKDAKAEADAAANKVAALPSAENIQEKVEKEEALKATKARARAAETALTNELESSGKNK